VNEPQLNTDSAIVNAGAAVCVAAAGLLAVVAGGVFVVGVWAVFFFGGAAMVAIPVYFAAWLLMASGLTAVPLTFFQCFAIGAALNVARFLLGGSKKGKASK
jgi:hypothetical protein